VSIVSVLLLVVAAFTVVGIVVAHRIEPFLRARIVDGLSQHFHARVDLDSFHVTIGNTLRGEWGIWAQGRGLRIWPPAQVAGVSVPNSTGAPLFSLAAFAFHAPLRYKSGTPIAISEIRLQGLELHLPPRSHFLRLEPQTAPANPSRSPLLPVSFALGSVVCNGAHLILETSKPGKLPMQIYIQRFRISDIQPNATMRFEADLTNPKPVGIVQTKGTFGPWQVWDPGESPIAGNYTFDHANLGDFKGISGDLSSTGSYQGTLRSITVDGETKTPNFALTHFGNTMDLQTKFHAIVDGTNGDTWLDPVNATLGHTRILAKGEVVRSLGTLSDGQLHTIGHDIDLKIEVDQGRIEDFLDLASHDSTPLFTGSLDLKSSLHIPPGKIPVHLRMGLKGHFTLDQTQFTSKKVEDRIEDLSLRGLGKPKEAKSAADSSQPPILANMQGDFTIANGVINLPDLAFKVPGADVELEGDYKLDGGALNFQGVAKMQATVSKMVGGWKGFLLKPADRLFRKDGAGTEVPVHVDGTYKEPEFSVDIKGFEVHTHPQRPDQNAHAASPDTSQQPSPSTPSPTEPEKPSASTPAKPSPSTPQSPPAQPRP